MVGAIALLRAYSPFYSLIAVALIVPGWFWLLLASSPTLDVGDDVVLIARKIGRNEFISYRDLLGVDR